MKIKILGTGCPKCKKLYAEAEKAIASSGVAVEKEKGKDLKAVAQSPPRASPSSWRRSTTSRSTAS